MDANLPPHKVKPLYDVGDFDKLLHDFDAVTDMPMALFIDDFLAGYPDPKVVVTMRDFDGWAASLRRTLFAIFASKAWDMLYPFGRKGFGDMRKAGRVSFEKLASNGDFMDHRQLRLDFDAHYEQVRAVVPKHRLLEFRCQDGWEPLCKFLGKDSPTAPFPRTNNATSHTAFVNKMFLFKYVEALLVILVSGGTVAVIVAAIWKHFHLLTECCPSFGQRQTDLNTIHCLLASAPFSLQRGRIPCFSTRKSRL